MFASVPSSGSTWLRSVVEVARGIASEHMYGLKGEGGQWHPQTLSFGKACGACSAEARNESVRLAVAPERVMVKTHFPFAAFNHDLDRVTSAPALVGGVVKTVRSPNETYVDCKRKKYAYVPSWSFEYFIRRERAFHEYWDNMTHTHTVINIPFQDLAQPHAALRHLMVLRKHFFPEITSASAARAIAVFPYKSRVAILPTPPNSLA